MDEVSYIRGNISSVSLTGAMSFFVYLFMFFIASEVGEYSVLGERRLVVKQRYSILWQLGLVLHVLGEKQGAENVVPLFSHQLFGNLYVKSIHLLCLK